MYNFCGNTEFCHDEEFHEGENLIHLFSSRSISLLELLTLSVHDRNYTAFIWKYVRTTRKLRELHG